MADHLKPQELDVSDGTQETPASVNRFTWERLLKASDAEPTTKLVGLVLGTYANRDGTSAHPGVKRLMADCSASDKTVRRHLVKLRELGLIHRVWHASHGGVSGYADRYILTEPPVTSDHHRSPESGPAVTGDLPPTMTKPVIDHSASLPLPHDKSRGEAGDDYDDQIEDLRDELEQWCLDNHSLDLDPEDHRTIDGMAGSGANPRAIANKVRKDVRDRWTTVDRWGDPWAAATPVPF